MNIPRGTFTVTLPMRPVKGEYKTCLVCREILNLNVGMGLYYVLDGLLYWFCDSCDFCYPFDWMDGEQHLSMLIERRKEVVRQELAGHKAS